MCVGETHTYMTEYGQHPKWMSLSQGSPAKLTIWTPSAPNSGSMLPSHFRKLSKLVSPFLIFNHWSPSPVVFIQDILMVSACFMPAHPI